ncbi:SAM-dependent methyltransferase [Streptomyces sp. KM273126]|uniref:SAM-dependent methyltransferase n=1 Tax=Streptomyces sp. KM273126 TaxID=2545247 RepID=UPI0026C47637|nr:SAM-dependent methyltransferase [Streptomyces sp. KM273126]
MSSWSRTATGGCFGRPPEAYAATTTAAVDSDGLGLLEPGLLSVAQWRPEQADAQPPAEVDSFAGVARKP